MPRFLLPPEPSPPPSDWSEIRIRQLLQFLTWPLGRLAKELGISGRALDYWIGKDQVKPGAHHRRLLDHLAERSGFLVAEKKSIRGMAYWPRGSQPRHAKTRSNRKRKGVYANYPVVGEDDSE